MVGERGEASSRWASTLSSLSLSLLLLLYNADVFAKPHAIIFSCVSLRLICNNFTPHSDMSLNLQQKGQTALNAYYICNHYKWERACFSVWKILLVLMFVNTFTRVLQGIDYFIKMTSCWGCSVFQYNKRQQNKLKKVTFFKENLRGTCLCKRFCDILVSRYDLVCYGLRPNSCNSNYFP